VIEPVPDRPAATAATPDERLLIIADYHAGIETVLRTEGVELADGSAERRERLSALLAETDPDRLVILGDLIHSIGTPWDVEREELAALFDGLSVPVTLVRGNHDGDIDSLCAELDHDITVTPPGGTRIGSLGFVHGHTYPDPDVLDVDVLCMGHEHPVVRLEDEVGGHRVERVWLRGALDPGPFDESLTDSRTADSTSSPELVVFPAFNDLSGGTWVNVAGQEFLSPYLPDALDSGEAYLLDGTRLGPYRDV
jgi:putative SbcD/Mre11-related phosphoesterase